MKPTRLFEFISYQKDNAPLEKVIYDKIQWKMGKYFLSNLL